MVDLPVLNLSREISIRDAMATILRGEGFRSLDVAETEIAWRLFLSQDPWLILIYCDRDSEDEIALIERILSSRQVPVLCTLRGGDIRLACRLMRAGARDVFVYPEDRDGLIRILLRLEREGVLVEHPENASRPSLTLWDRRIEWRNRQKALLERNIQECGGNISLVARRIGCARGTVYNRMRMLGITIGKRD